MISNNCSHKNLVNKLPIKDVSSCEDCMRTGDTWVNLRQCLVCGHVGCCNSSKNKHATKHFEQTDHPIVKSVTPGEEFTWCFVDEIYL